MDYPCLKKEVLDIEILIAFGYLTFFFVGIVLLLKWIKKGAEKQERQKPSYQRHNGAFIHAEIFNAHTLKRHNRTGTIYVFDILISRYIKLGFTSEQHGAQTKISLFGDWERVDENTIKGMVEFYVEEGSFGTYKSRTGTTVTFPKWWEGPIECNLKVGDVLPVGRRIGRSGSGHIKAEIPPHIVLKITHIYIPGDSPTDRT